MLKWMRGMTVFSFAGIAGIVGVGLTTDILPCSTSTVMAAQKEEGATCPKAAEAKKTAEAKGECCASKTKATAAAKTGETKVTPAVAGGEQCDKTKATAAVAGGDQCPLAAAAAKKTAEAKGDCCSSKTKTAAPAKSEDKKSDEPVNLAEAK